MDAWNRFESISPGSDAHPLPVHPGNAVPSAPIVVGAGLPVRLVACASCAAEVPAQRFCCACGTQLAPTACDCGVDLPPGACYCAACGIPVSAA